LGETMHWTIHDYALTSERRHTSRIPNSRVVTSRKRIRSLHFDAYSRQRLDVKQ
jgi:hypothetical protein